MLEFEESGMRFQFPEKNTFYIEKTAPYDTDLRSYGVSSVECVTLYGEKVLFIEAKMSAPNPKSAGGEKLSSYIQRIVKKFYDSLSLCCAIQSEVWTGESIGGELVKKLSRKPEIVFVLIINKHEREWSASVQDRLQRDMRGLLKIWRAHVIVINAEQALARHLIVSAELLMEK